MMKTWIEAWDAATIDERKTVRRWSKGIKERSGLRGDRNQCPTCAEFFGSTTAFEKHKTGMITVNRRYTTNRRCLSIPEMSDKGFYRNEHFYWVTGSMDASIVFKDSPAALPLEI